MNQRFITYKHANSFKKCESFLRHYWLEFSFGYIALICICITTPVSVFYPDVICLPHLAIQC